MGVDSPTSCVRKHTYLSNVLCLTMDTIQSWSGTCRSQGRDPFHRASWLRAVTYCEQRHMNCHSHTFKYFQGRTGKTLIYISLGGRSLQLGCGLLHTCHLQGMAFLYMSKQNYTFQMCSCSLKVFFCHFCLPRDKTDIIFDCEGSDSCKVMF